MFDGFEVFDVEVDGVRIHGRRGGSGPPVLLLHGMGVLGHRASRSPATTVVAAAPTGWPSTALTRWTG